MTDGYPDAIAPQNERDRITLQVLDRLKSGEPLGGIDNFGVLRPIPSSVKNPIRSLVNDSREKGCTSDRRIFWITAPRGGGKTEALASIERELFIETYKEEFGKSAVVSVDLKRVSQTATGSGLQAAIFENATSTKSSPFKENIDHLKERLTENAKTEKIRENLIGLGTDIILSLANVAAPGGGTVATFLGTNLTARLQRWWKFREANIHKLLKAKGIVSPDAINLLTRWFKYSFQPNQKNWRELEQVFQPLADKEVLFPILCVTLQATGYTTIVLSLDEVDQVLNGTDLTRTLERLWDPPRDSDFYNHRINIFFVMAGTEKIKDLKNETLYAGFARRFMGAKTVPITISELRPPSVQRALNTNDDFTHAMNKIKDLVESLPDGRIKQVSPEKELELRNSLADLRDVGKLTWYDLWAAVCNIYGLR